MTTQLIVIGAGAVGCTLATYLLHAQRPVALFTRPKDHGSFSTAAGLQLVRQRGGPLHSPLPLLVSSIPKLGPLTLLMATKFSALEAVLASIAEVRGSGEGLTLLSTLNGVQALPLIRQYLPAAEAVPLTIMFNAQLLAPLQAELTTTPAVILGSQRSDLVQLFKGTGLQLSTAKGETACWGKLLINLGNALGALTQSTFKDLLTQPLLRQCYAAVLQEAIDRLRASQIDFRLPMPLPPGAYLALLRHGGGLAWWLAQRRNGLGEGAYPSMVSDVRAGRSTEVQQLNGEIVALGARLNWPAPLNQQLLTAVQALSGPQTQAAYTPQGLAALLGLGASP